MLTYLQSNIQSTTDESCCSEHNRMSTEKILTNIKGDVLKNKSKIDALPPREKLKSDITERCSSSLADNLEKNKRKG